MMDTQSTDADLLQRYASKGDREALAELFRRQAPYAYRVAYAVLGRRGSAEDAVQEAFLKLMAKASSYDPRWPFQPWLKTLVARTAIDLGRGASRRRARDLAAPAPPAPEDPAMLAADAESRQRLEDGIEALPEDLRLPLTLHYQGGLAYAEVARVLDCPEGTVATRLATARDRLRTSLTGVLPAAGLSLEEALGNSVPSCPAHLARRLEALARRGAPPALDVGFPLKAAGVALLLCGAGLGGYLTMQSQTPETKSAPAAPTSPPPAPPPPSAPTPPPAEPVAPASAEIPKTGPAAISGRVLQHRTDRPVPGAVVLMVISGTRLASSHGEALEHRGFRNEHTFMTSGHGEPVSHSFFSKSVQADATGRYAFEDVPEGLPFRLRVAETGTKEAYSPIGNEAPEKALEAGERRTRDLSLALQGGMLLKLRRADGLPVGTISMNLHNRGMGTTMGLPPQTGMPDGVFRLDRSRLGGMGDFPALEATYALKHPQLLPLEGRVADLPFENGSYVLEAVFQTGRRVSGVLLGPHGMPCAGYVSVSPKDGSPGRNCWPDADGRFVLEGLPTDVPLQVLAEAPEGFTRGDILLPPAAAPEELRLTLEAAAEIAGQALDAHGMPIAEADVEARTTSPSGYPVSRQAKTGSDGRFVIRGLPAGSTSDVGFPVVNTHHELVLEGRVAQVKAGTRDLVLRR